MWKLFSTRQPPAPMVQSTKTTTAISKIGRNVEIVTNTVAARVIGIEIGNAAIEVENIAEIATTM